MFSLDVLAKGHLSSNDQVSFRNNKRDDYCPIETRHIPHLKKSEPHVKGFNDVTFPSKRMVPTS